MESDTVGNGAIEFADIAINLKVAPREMEIIFGCLK